MLTTWQRWKHDWTRVGPSLQQVFFPSLLDLPNVFREKDTTRNDGCFMVLLEVVSMIACRKNSSEVSYGRYVEHLAPLHSVICSNSSTVIPSLSTTARSFGKIKLSSANHRHIPRHTRSPGPGSTFNAFKTITTELIPQKAGWFCVMNCSARGKYDSRWPE